MKEIWRNIKGGDGQYKISNLGRVKSLEQKLTIYNPHKDVTYTMVKPERILKLYVNHNGYYVTNLTLNGKHKPYLLHRIMAKAFIPNRENKPCINHKDGIKTNNELCNLEWCTRAENNAHAWKTGLMDNHKNIDFNGSNNPFSKLDENEVLQIRSIYEQGWANFTELGKCYNVCRTTVSDIIKRKTWNHI